MGSICRRSAFLLSAVLLGSAALGFEPAVRRDVSAGDGSLRLTIGSVRVPLWSAALAQGADTVSLDDVTITLGTSSYAIKRIEFSGVTSSEAEIRALFDDAASEPLGARLERLGAKEIRIPEIVAEERIAEFRGRSVYRNVVASDVERGRIRLLTAEGVTGEASGPKGKTVIVQDGLTSTDTDLAAFLRIYTRKAGPQPEPMTKIQGSSSVEKTTIIDDQGAIVKVGRATLRDLSMRPTQESWSGTASLLTAMAEIDKPSEQEVRRALSALLDASDSVQIGSFEVTGIEVNLRVNNDNLAAGVRRLAYTGATPTQPAEARIEGFAFEMPEGTAKIDTISYSGFSFEPTFRGLRAVLGKPLDKIEELDPATIRSLIPTIGTLRYAGLSFDLEIARENGDGTDRVQVSLKEAELTADKPLNGIPTAVRAAVRNLTFPIPTDGKDESLKTIRDLGYTALDISYAVAATWSETTQEILVKEAGDQGAEIGKITLAGVLGVTRDVFDPDGAVATAALLGASAKSLDLTIENAGLGERYLQQEAAKQKKSPEDLRREYAAAAALAVPLMLGSSEQAKTIGQAVAKFVARPTRLRISARAKDPRGLAVVEAVTAGNPAAVLEKLDVTATTDERP
ncbi:MAG TPA: hypothetical protein VHG30_17800 [Microvirga sp.]|nr:hypothetical protein [Microvirga sp.]